MARSNYPFLKRNQKSEDQRRQEDIESLWNQLGTLGFQPGGRSFFTGYGEDGRLQPDRPTAILNTRNEGQATVHEGEQVKMDGSGNLQQVIPASQMGGQQNLQRMEQQRGMRGFEDGYTRGAPGRSLDTATLGEGTNYGFEGFAGAEMSKLNDNVTINATPDTGFSGFVGAEMPKLNDDVAIPKATAVAENAGNAGLSGARTLGDIKADTPFSGFVGAEMPKLNDDVTIPKATAVTDGTGLSGARPLNEIQAETSEPAPTVDPYSTTFDRGLQRLERYADYESPREQAMRDAERERFAGEAAVSQGSMAQTLAQGGITGREAATEQAMLGRQIGAEESALMSNLRKAEGDRAFQAAQQIPGEARAQQQFQEQIRQFDTIQDRNTYTDLINAGDYDGAADFMEKTTGVRPDMTRIKATAELSDKVANYEIRGLTGAALADIYELNPDTWWGEDDLSGNAMREHWDANFPDRAGDYGEDFANWANEQEAILKDPANRTMLGTLKSELQTDVEAGNMTQEDADAITEYVLAVQSGRIDENGNVIPLDSQWANMSEDEQWSSYENTMASVDPDMQIDKAKWVELDKPKTYKDTHSEKGWDDFNTSEKFESFKKTVPVSEAQDSDVLFRTWGSRGQPQTYEQYTQAGPADDDKPDSNEVNNVALDFAAEGKDVTSLTSWDLDSLQEAVLKNPDSYVVSDPTDTDMFYKNGDFVSLYEIDEFGASYPGFAIKKEDARKANQINTIKAHVKTWIKDNVGTAIDIGGRPLIPLEVKKGKTADWKDSTGFPDTITFLDPITKQIFTYAGRERIDQEMVNLGIIPSTDAYKV